MLNRYIQESAGGCSEHHHDGQLWADTGFLSFVCRFDKFHCSDTAFVRRFDKYRCAFSMFLPNTGKLSIGMRPLILRRRKRVFVTHDNENTSFCFLGDFEVS